MSKAYAKTPTASFVFRRAPIQDRKLETLVRRSDALRALSNLQPGAEIFCFTYGQFSMIDVLYAMLDQTGPARVDISTWTIGDDEIRDVERLLKDDRLESVRFLFDFSFPRRQPGYCADLVQRFGLECVRVTKNHAKLLIIRNDKWNIVVRSTANLNTNRRFEHFEITDSLEMAEWLEAVINEVFQIQGPADMVEQSPQYHKNRFNEFRKEVEDLAENSEFGASLEDFLSKGDW